jgi:Beta-lactamase
MITVAPLLRPSHFMITRPFTPENTTMSGRSHVALSRQRPSMSAAVAAITLCELMTMSGGFPGIDPAYEIVTRMSPRGHSVAYLLRERQVAVGRTQFLYSNTSSHLLAAAFGRRPSTRWRRPSTPSTGLCAVSKAAGRWLRVDEQVEAVPPLQSTLCDTPLERTSSRMRGSDRGHTQAVRWAPNRSDRPHGPHCLSH